VYELSEGGEMTMMRRRTENARRGKPLCPTPNRPSYPSKRAARRALNHPLAEPYLCRCGNFHVSWEPDDGNAGT
jgi:hypothetical protein